jgi:hypothetical protein
LVFDESKLAAEQKCADGYLYRFGKSDDGFYFQTERQLPVRARGIFTALHIIIIIIIIIIIHQGVYLIIEWCMVATHEMAHCWW